MKKQNLKYLISKIVERSRQLIYGTIILCLEIVFGHNSRNKLQDVVLIQKQAQQRLKVSGKSVCLAKCQQTNTKDVQDCTHLPHIVRFQFKHDIAPGNKQNLSHPKEIKFKKCVAKLAVG